ncbi:helix-turn-helix domain-containing protein [Streptomyces sp. NPDC085481]|uniref:AraC-like ligand-binding domain-containing protein n=1 Tax=Streptomyces sp. NPDC085481 TaxID=3365727 RepID=UPI0037D23B75
MAEAFPFDWFCETVSNEVMPVSLNTKHVSDFSADITDVELGPLRVSAYTFSPVLARRTAAHIRRGDPEHYHLTWVRRGSFQVAQLGREALVNRAMVLADTSRPTETRGICDDGRITAVVLQIPRTALALRSGRVDGLLAQRIPAASGTAAILTGFLGTLLDHAPLCGEQELAAMGSVTLDLVTACLAQQLGALEEAPADARAQVMMQRITRFIENNLGDPDLTPQTIADRHGISLRTLYALFRDRPLSVAAFIRRQRLERCRADLACPRLSSQPVQAIAARWGFASSTVFSRVFREAYGVTPSEHRASALRPSDA